MIQRSLITPRRIFAQDFGFVRQRVESLEPRDERRNPIRNLRRRFSFLVSGAPGGIAAIKVKRRRQAQEFLRVTVNVDAPNVIAVCRYRREENFVFRQEVAPNKFCPRLAKIIFGKKFLQIFIGRARYQLRLGVDVFFERVSALAVI